MIKSIHPTIYEDDLIVIYLEVALHGAPFLHYDLKEPFGKRVWLHLQEKWAEVARAFKDQGFNNVYCASSDPVVMRIAGRLGFTYGVGSSN